MKYYKLGKGASIFYCPVSKVKIIGNQIVAVDGKKISKKLVVAERHAHIVASTEAEYNAYVKSLGEDTPTKELAPNENPLAEKFNAMTKAELDKYLEDNFEVDEAYLTKFKASNKAEKIASLIELEAE